MYDSAKRAALTPLTLRAAYDDQTCYDVETRDTLVDLCALPETEDYGVLTPRALVAPFNRPIRKALLSIGPRTYLLAKDEDGTPTLRGFTTLPKRLGPLTAMAYVSIMQDQMVRVTHTDTFRSPAMSEERWRVYFMPEGIIYVDGKGHLDLIRRSEAEVQTYLDENIRIGLHKTAHQSGHAQLRQITRMKEALGLILVSESFGASIPKIIDRMPHLDLTLVNRSAQP
jgi:hypothetical protein